MKLTKRQKEILDFITEFMEREGYSPSMGEIAAHFNIASLNAVYKHLEALESRGHLRRDPNRARAIELAGEKTGVRELPLYGYIAAGRPIEAVSTSESLSVPADFLTGRGPHYILRVQGQSMIGESIDDGDYVIVESREKAERGETVVALIDGENVTLKKFYPEGSQIRLQPANADIPPITLDSQRVRVQGVVIGVMRKYR